MRVTDVTDVSTVFFCFFEKDEIQCELSIGQSDIVLPKQ